jgi:Zn-dependent M32 family carboxypeptidase
MSFINYNEERIKVLEKKAEKYDALCELVEALREANEVDREYADMRGQQLEHLKQIVQEEIQKKEGK